VATLQGELQVIARRLAAIEERGDVVLDGVARELAALNTKVDKLLAALSPLIEPDPAPSIDGLPEPASDLAARGGTVSVATD
jgi:hypothetical protein